MVGIILQRVLCIIEIRKLIVSESGGDLRLNSGLLKNVMSRYHSDHSESICHYESALGNGEPLKVAKPSSYVVRSVFKKVIQEFS